MTFKLSTGRIQSNLELVSLLNTGCINLKQVHQYSHFDFFDRKT